MRQRPPAPILLFLALIALSYIFMSVTGKIRELSINELETNIGNKNIVSINIHDNGEIQGYLKNQKGPNVIFASKITPTSVDQWIKDVKQKSPETIIKSLPPKPPNFLISMLPWIIPIGIIYFLFRGLGARMSSQNGQFVSSKAKLYSETNTKTTFNDIAGVDEAIDEVREVVEFLKTPTKFSALGGKIPKGILLIGPPGTGKTLLARAVAGEAGTPFHYISGSDFVEMFAGVGAARVRDLFIKAKRKLPSIIFIDELDAVGRHRGTGIGHSHDEREQTLNQLLVEMSGFETNQGLVVMAATNRPDVLDPALLRPGRFDRQVTVSRPDIKGRAAILKIHTKIIVLDDNVNLGEIARGTSGFTGADLMNLCNEAALMAAKNNRKVVAMADFQKAIDKLVMGTERRSMVISEAEKRITAYHEAGHAIVALRIPQADPLYKVSIIPRGMALGITTQLPEEDKHNYTKEFLTSQLAIIMGGRCAEELIDLSPNNGNITTGASNDIERATEIARNMVCKWGMSSLGLRKFGTGSDHPFLGRQMTEIQKDYSEETAKTIDSEINNFINTAHETAKSILAGHLHYLHQTAKLLLDRETVSGEEIKQLLNPQTT